MAKENTYKKQQRLSVIQFLSELPNFLATGISGLITGSMIVWIDFLDSLTNVMRTGIVSLLSKSLSRDQKYKYNYGVSKIEALTSILCDSVALLGLLFITVATIHEIMHPQTPSKYLIYVVVLKLINVCLDAYFLKTQKRICRENNGLVAKSSYSAALGMLLFDMAGMISLVVVWATRGIASGLYLTPFFTILIVIYMVCKCVARMRTAVDELTDKTIQEEQQMQILKVLTRYFDSYSKFHQVKSHNAGGIVQIDLVLSFWENTTVKDVVSLKNILQKEISELIDNCYVNIILK